MRLTARVDYALRAAAELAAAAGRGWVSAEQLAQAQTIPLHYLESILLQLRRAGIVRSQRGSGGGHQLARPPAEVTLAHIIRALDGPLANIHGERPEDVHYEGPAAALRDVWIALRANERRILEQVTLEQVAAGRLAPAIQRLADDPTAWT